MGFFSGTRAMLTSSKSFGENGIVGVRGHVFSATEAVRNKGMKQWRIWGTRPWQNAILPEVHTNTRITVGTAMNSSHSRKAKAREFSAQAMFMHRASKTREALYIIVKPGLGYAQHRLLVQEEGPTDTRHGPQQDQAAFPSCRRLSSRLHRKPPQPPLHMAHWRQGCRSPQ